MQLYSFANPEATAHRSFCWQNTLPPLCEEISHEARLPAFGGPTACHPVQSRAKVVQPRGAQIQGNRRLDVSTHSPKVGELPTIQRPPNGGHDLGDPKLARRDDWKKSP
jgi:hypothetical protein